MTFPVFVSFSNLGKRRETETSLKTRTRMVDYEVRDLETLVLVESDDEDLEELLLQKYLERQNDLAEAAASRRELEFNFDAIPNLNFKDKFRFMKADVPCLCDALGIPAQFIAPNRTTWSGLEGLCILHRRLSYPAQTFQLGDYFGRGSADISIITNTMLSYVYDRWNRLLVDLSEHTRQGRWLSLAKLQEAAAAVHRKGPLSNVWGFIDGTARQIRRPSRGQRIWYSGHKRQHVQKFQAIMTPFGIMVHLYGPIEGQRHDARILRMSGLLDQLAQHIPRHGPNPDDVFVLYGDSAYPLRAYMQAPFGGAHKTPAERQFNSLMSKSRICVEWGFCDISAKFGIVDHKRNQRLLHEAVGKYYAVAAILTNCHTCLYENETSSHFNLAPPTLEEYLQ